MKTITGREIKVRSNQTARTFTIYVDTAVYRTIPLSGEEFRSCEGNTGQDWAEFLKTEDYYLVRKR